MLRRLSQSWRVVVLSEKYWVERGKTYLVDFYKKTVIQMLRYKIQEQVIIGALHKVRREREVQRILDAGCGFGRITRILCVLFPFADIHGIDISYNQLKIAEKQMSRVQFRKNSIINPTGGVPLNQLTTAVEVLMHIEPAGIEGAVETLTRGALDFIITVDWWTDDREEIKAGKDAGFCYLHNYGKLFSDAGFYRVKEKKIPFVKQKIRVWRKRENV